MFGLDFSEFNKKQPGLADAPPGYSLMCFLPRNLTPNQMIERAEGGFCAFAHGDDDLFIRDGGAVSGGEDAGEGGLAFGVDLDFSPVG